MAIHLIPLSCGSLSKSIFVTIYVITLLSIEVSLFLMTKSSITVSFSFECIWLKMTKLWKQLAYSNCERTGQCCYPQTLCQLVPGKLRSYIYDTVLLLYRTILWWYRNFLTSYQQRQHKKIGWLLWHPGKGKEFFLTLSIYLHMIFQVISFKPGWVTNNKQYNNHSINLLGKIRTVCCLLLHLTY